MFKNQNINTNIILQLVIFSFFIVILLKVFVLDFFELQSESMSPTLQKGDKVIISRINYYIGFPVRFPIFNIKINNPIQFWYKDIKKGDVVIFNLDNENEKIFVKRVTGLPGDFICKNENGIAGDFILIKNENSSKFFQNSAIIPYKNQTVTINPTNYDLYKNIIESEGNKLDIKYNGEILINNQINNRYKFKNDYLFLEGDNAPHSRDSRYFGLVPKKNISGKPLLIYWCIQKNKIETSRILNLIQ